MRHLPLHSLITPLLDALFPPQCLTCGTIITEHGTVCTACWTQISFITAPMCARCGLPFEYAIGEGALCGVCLQEAPVFLEARAAFRYDDHSKSLVTRLKYNDETLLAKACAPWLLRAAGGMLEQTDLIVPVPLHYRRWLSRRYNQAALLAQALARTSGVSCLPDGLKRHRATTSQTGLTRSERVKNVKNAFIAPKAKQKYLSNKRVLLVDDVFTTGATLNACSLALLNAGALEVRVVTLARRV